MADLKGARIGCAMTGSFCTFREAFQAWKALKAAGAELQPIMSPNAYALDTRFFSAEEARAAFREICGREIWSAVPQVEPIGPRKLLDLLVVLPCTGNTLAKLAAGIADTAPTLAVKSQLRNGGAVLLGVSTNDGLAQAARNIGALLPEKHIFFLPFRQDSPLEKPTSLVADFSLLRPAAEAALDGRQLQPLLLTAL